jgi:drug/metabolite transporter (DMT)-like permease
MTELSYLLAVLSAGAYGAADFLGGLATKRSTPCSVVVFSQLAGLILVLIALPLLPRAAPTARDFAWGAASGLAGGVGVALLYRGLAIGVMSVVAPVTAVCSVVIPLVVGLAQGERPAGQAIAGVLLAIAAIVLVSQSDHAEPGKRATTGLAIAIASGICIGVFLVLLQRTGPSAGLWPLAAARVVSVCCFIVVAMVVREKLRLTQRAAPLVISGGALDMVANILYLLAVRQGPLGIVATLASLYPASTVVLARLLLRERLRAIQLGGVVCASVAIVLIVSA